MRCQQNNFVCLLKDEGCSPCLCLLTQTELFFKCNNGASVDVLRINLANVCFVSTSEEALYGDPSAKIFFSLRKRINVPRERRFFGFVVSSLSNAAERGWNLKHNMFWCYSEAERSLWMSMLNSRIQAITPSRPRRLIVFINPSSGSKHAGRIYADTVAPLFHLAKIKTDVITTTHRGHMTNYLLENTLDDYDGVICVGGDGFLAEAMQGLLLRVRITAGLALFCGHQPGGIELPSAMRVGVIPAGSTDTVVFSTHGTNDVFTAALHIIVGDDLAVDVAALHSGADGSFVRYATSMLGYGFHADLLRNDDKYRWMGPRRYDYSGLRAFMSNSAYFGEISYLPSANHKSHATDGVLCTSGCSVCSLDLVESDVTFSDSPSSSQSASSSPATFLSQSHRVRSHSNPPSADNLTKQKAFRENILGGKQNKDHVNFYIGSRRPLIRRSACTLGCIASAVHPKSQTNLATRHSRSLIVHDKRKRVADSTSNLSLLLFDIKYPPSWSIQTRPNEWHTVRGVFMAINAFVQSCRCAKASQGPAPWAHLGDGCIDLVLVHECSRIQFLQFLLRVASSSPRGHKSALGSPFDLPYVSVQRVCAFRFKSLADIPKNTASIPDSISYQRTNGVSVQYQSQPALPIMGKSRLKRSRPSNSIWCTDGETIHCSDVEVYVHRQLIRMFARGPVTLNSCLRLEQSVGADKLTPEEIFATLLTGATHCNTQSPISSQISTSS